MLSSVTINCQVRMIVWIQVLNCQNCNQCLKCQLSSTVFPILKNESEKWGWKMRIKNEGQKWGSKWGSKMRVKKEGQKWGSKMRVKNESQKWGSKWGSKMRVKNEGQKSVWSNVKGHKSYIYQICKRAPLPIYMRNKSIGLLLIVVLLCRLTGR